MEVKNKCPLQQEKKIGLEEIIKEVQSGFVKSMYLLGTVITGVGAMDYILNTVDKNYYEAFKYSGCALITSVGISILGLAFVCSYGSGMDRVGQKKEKEP